jgi:hypothetical protein
MSLQEKINKLPLSIEQSGIVFNLEIRSGNGIIALGYVAMCKTYLFYEVDERSALNTSFRLEGMVDRALKVIESKEWEK